MDGPDVLHFTLNEPFGERHKPHFGLCETDMVLRVPILGSDDQVKVRHEIIDWGNDFIAAWDGKGPTGTEVVLNVNYDECFHFRNRFMIGSPQLLT